MGPLKYLRLKLSIVSVFILASSCATTPTEPLPPLPEVPNYLQVSHPMGFDAADVRAIFLSQTAPKGSMGQCDKVLKILIERAQSKAELESGVRELVVADPVGYHWCFYSKILDVEDTVKNEALWTVRQKRVVDNYQFLVPLAHAFRIEFNDSRYLRWAIKQYRQMAEWVFFRSLTLSPEASMTMLESVDNPFALWKKPNEAQVSVLQKYGLQAETLAPGPDSKIEMDRRPASSTTQTPEAPQDDSPEQL